MLLAGGCAWMPREVNLAPLWFHRADEQGALLEWDLLWPLVHWERAPDGGEDFRLRPLYRRTTEPALQAVEHQFLWPFGRVRRDAEETSHRLWPLWSWRDRTNGDGHRDLDWYLLFPFVWGGDSSDDREDYFAVLPFWADIPQFLVYDRMVAFLFPLYLRLDKEGHRHHQMLWPLIGWSNCAENDHSWFRVLPFYGHDIEPGQHDRRFLLWPFFAWSTENEFADDPVTSFWLWPLFGWRTGRTVGGWMALWPFFQQTWKQDHFSTLTLFWPLFRHHWNRADRELTQWWLWPFVGHARTTYQNNWSFVWPLVWWRRFADPEGSNAQEWVLPFYWHVRQEPADDHREEFVKLWPFVHWTDRTDTAGRSVGGDWSLLSPWPWREGNATGMAENYGFLWELAVGRQRAPDDRSLDVVGRLYTDRERGGSRTASVPLLGSYERRADGRRTLWLMQFLPIPLASEAPPPAAQSPETPP
jgi:hypothetical protein